MKKLLLKPLRRTRVHPTDRRTLALQRERADQALVAEARLQGMAWFSAR